MAKSHYTFKKRQKELARLKKKEEKRQRKQGKRSVESDDMNESENMAPQNGVLV